MTQRNNPYLQNRFEDNNAQPVTSRRKAPRAPRGQAIREKLTTRFTSNPILAATALMFAGAAFATIIIASYPDKKDPGQIPVVQADAQPFREMPTDMASAESADQQSTIYSTLRSDRLNETAPIENLLDQEEAVDRPAETITTAKTTDTTATATPAVTASATPVETAPPTAPLEAPAPLPAPLPAPTTSTTGAGQSSDTLAFVQSVLDKKDGKTGDVTTTSSTTTTASAAPIAPTASASMNNVEPASGGAFAPGTFYVQLGSVTSRTGADTEWKKMQKATPSLNNAAYRVEEATVADKGTFYRIQAGPMSKESAGRLCDTIKAQSPGGCLIVPQ